MNCISARSSRASAPFSTTKRAPDSFAAVSKSIRPERFADLEMLARLEAVGKCGGAPWRRTSTLSCSSLPSGTSASGRLGIAASSRSSAAAAAFSCASISGIATLSRPTSCLSVSASAASLRPIAAPISFEAALRRSCAFCNSRIAARRRSSSAISAADAGLKPATRQTLVESAGIVANGLDVVHEITQPAAAGAPGPGRRRR